MAGLLVTLLLLLPLSPPFGEASATASSAEDGLRLEVAVEVTGTPVAVVVRGVAAGEEELPPVALSDRGDGVWQGIVDLPVVENILLGFEFIPGRGEVKVSELNLLTDLGVDRAVFEAVVPPSGFGASDDEPLSPQGQRWGWLGLGAGAAALFLLALWALDSHRSDDDEESTAEADPMEAADPVVD